MKQRAFKEQVFKLLFRADFNTKEELLEQVPIYFESGDLTVVPEDRARIEERLRPADRRQAQKLETGEDRQGGAHCAPHDSL